MRVSIITVVFNSIDTIRDALDSVQGQSHENIEYIVVDGGSTDGTLELLQSRRNRITHLISGPDRGIYDAMNKGIGVATGEVIAFLNSDDFFLDHEAIGYVSKRFSEDGALDVLLGGVDFVKPTKLDQPVRRYGATRFRPWMFRFGMMPPHPGSFVRRSAYERVGFYKLGYRIAADFDFLTRLLLLDGAKFTTTSKTFVRMRTGGASTNGLKSNMVATREIGRSLKENGVFTNYLMLFCRLPVKLFTQVLLRGF